MKALTDAFEDEIHLLTQGLRFLAGVGEEERRAELLHAEGLDDLLGLPRTP